METIPYPTNLEKTSLRYQLYNRLHRIQARTSATIHTSTRFIDCEISFDDQLRRFKELMFGNPEDNVEQYTNLLGELNTRQFLEHHEIRRRQDDLISNIYSLHIRGDYIEKLPFKTNHANKTC